MGQLKRPTSVQSVEDTAPFCFTAPILWISFFLFFSASPMRNWWLHIGTWCQSIGFYKDAIHLSNQATHVIYHISSIRCLNTIKVYCTTHHPSPINTSFSRRGKHSIYYYHHQPTFDYCSGPVLNPVHLVPTFFFLTPVFLQKTRVHDIVPLKHGQEGAYLHALSTMMPIVASTTETSPSVSPRRCRRPLRQLLSIQWIHLCGKQLLPNYCYSCIFPLVFIIGLWLLGLDIVDLSPMNNCPAGIIRFSSFNWSIWLGWVFISALRST